MPKKPRKRRRTTFAQADLVVDKVSELIGDPPWLMGIAIVRDDVDGFAVSVRYGGPRPVVALPERIDDVKVTLDKQGTVRFQ